MSRWKLPPMTDPMGRNWDQPKGLRDRVGLFETHATIDESDWLRLRNYETTVPTGVYPGKVWRRGTLLCWYGPEIVQQHSRDQKTTYCKIGRLRALVTGPGTNVTWRPS